MTEPTDSPEPKKWNRAYGEQADAMGMTLLQTFRVRLDAASEQHRGGYMALVDDRSSLRLDDRYLGTWRGSSQAVGSLGVAIDAIRTVLDVTLTLQVVPMTSLYPMLRAALENASLALYLLEPVDRDERLRRAYWVAADDARLRATHEVTRGTEGADEKRAGVIAEIRELVSERPSLGDPATFPLPQLKYSDVIRLAEEALDRDPAVTVDREMPLLGMWQLLSGLSHGKQWAMIEVLERSGAIVDEDDASAHIVMTSSPGVIAWFTERILDVLEAAMRAYGRRAREWTNQPEDAVEPPSVPYVEQRRQRHERRAARAAEAGE